MTGWALAGALVLSGLCAALAAWDLRRYLLPDALTLALGVAGLGFAALLEPEALPDRLIGAAAGYAVFDLIARAYRHFRGRDGLGAGDAKLMAAGGAWVGWQGLASVVLVGTMVALAMTLLTAKLAGRDLSASTRVPLGAYLSAGIWITWIMGPISF